MVGLSMEFIGNNYRFVCLSCVICLIRLQLLIEISNKTRGVTSSQFGVSTSKLIKQRWIRERETVVIDDTCCSSRLLQSNTWYFTERCDFFLFLFFCRLCVSNFRLFSTRVQLIQLIVQKFVSMSGIDVPQESFFLGEFLVTMSTQNWLQL